MAKGSIHRKIKTILNEYVPNSRASRCMRGEIGKKSTVVVRISTCPLSNRENQKENQQRYRRSELHSQPTGPSWHLQDTPPNNSRTHFFLVPMEYSPRQIIFWSVKELQQIFRIKITNGQEHEKQGQTEELFQMEGNMVTKCNACSQWDGTDSNMWTGSADQMTVTPGLISLLEGLHSGYVDECFLVQRIDTQENLEVMKQHICSLC